MTPSAILFDLDGTLVDSRADIAEAFAHAAASLRTGLVVRVEDVAPHVGRPLADMAASLGIALAAEERARFENAYRARYDELGGRRTVAFPGVRELLAELAPRPVGVVTTKVTRQARMILEATGLAPHVRAVQGHEPGIAFKPSPEPVERLLALLDASPEDAVLVGDSPVDVLAGRAAGVLTIAVTWGAGAEEVLRLHAPAHVVQDVSELRALLLGPRT